jgi:hypothetical protein
VQYAILPLESERGEITPDAYSELEEIRQAWRDDGDDMLIINYEDGQSSVIRHPMNGAPPTSEQLAVAHRRSGYLDILLFGQMGGCA